MHTDSRQQGNAPAADSSSFHQSILQPGRSGSRFKGVGKSVIVVAAIGLAACLGLSVAMQRLLEIQQQQSSSPLELELEAQLERRLVGPVRVTQEPRPDGFRTLVRLRVLAGLQKGRVADAVGATVWRHALQARELPREVAVAVGDEDGDVVENFVIPPPTQRRGVGQAPMARSGADRPR
jgi:hypothetical protein